MSPAGASTSPRCLRLLLICVVAWLANADNCDELVATYLRTSKKEPVPVEESTMLYFLHIPRTAGRTFHTCLLRPAFPFNKRCPKSYDHLRVNTSVPNCFLLSSHDDYSVVDLLPENVAVISQLRDPVDRLLSAYEFAIELGTRNAFRKQTPKAVEGRVLTENVWPWSYLIPFFAADIKQRAAALRAGIAQDNTQDDPHFDPYNNKLVMPLKDFIEHPIAQELLHNGGLLQVLGLTNYSHRSDAAELRNCFAQGHAATRETLLKFALQRLSKFSHVGTTDRLSESVAACAASLNTPLDKPPYAWSEGAPRRRPLSHKSRHGSDDLDDHYYDEDEDGAHGQDSDSDSFTRAHEPGVERANGGAGHGASQHQSPVEHQDGSKAADKQPGAGLGAEEVPRALELSEQTEDAALNASQAREMLEDVEAKFETALKAGTDAEVEALRLELNLAKAAFRDAQGQYLSARERSLQQEQRAITRPAGVAQMNRTLGVEYQKCAYQSQRRNTQRRDSSLKRLAMPNNGPSVTFGKLARVKIPDEIIELIRRKNDLDVELHSAATRMLTEKRAALTSAHRLQDLKALSSEQMALMARPKLRAGRAGTAGAQRRPLAHQGRSSSDSDSDVDWGSDFEQPGAAE